MLLVFLFVGCLTPEDGEEDDTSGSSDTGEEPGPGGPSRVERSCAPDDGAATLLVVGMDEATCEGSFDGVPHVRITLWEGTDWPLLPGTYPFDEGSGSAWYLGDRGIAEEYARSGSVTIVTATGGTVSGSYRVELDGGEVVAGAFEAMACETVPECG